MAEVGGRARAAGWLLLGIAAMALDGCFERHEPSNPFIGPFGSAEEGSFGALPAAAGSRDQARLVRPAPAPGDLLHVQPPGSDGLPVALPGRAVAQVPPSSSAGTASD
jgi:hypothetical protein